MRSESLVRMFVTVYDDVGVSLVQILPKLAKFGMDGMAFQHAAALEGVVAERGDARLGMFGQVFLQP